MASPTKMSKDPQAYLPTEWEDDKRMQVRFAEFRPKEANPEGWESKLNFWIKAINKWCSSCHVVRFTLNNVREAFVRNNQRPDSNCLKVVISNMLRQQSLMLHEDFVKMCKQNEGWLDWGYKSVVKKPLSFGWSLLSASGGDEAEKIEENVSLTSVFVNLDSIKVCSQMLLDRFEGDAAWYKYEDFVKMAKEEFSLDQAQLDCLIMYMEHQKTAKLYVEDGVKVIKFGNNAQFSDADISLIKLELAKRLIEGEIVRCEDELDACKDEARQCVREGNKIKAKAILKKKKRLEALISKKEVQLDNVMYLVDQFSQSDSNKLVIDAYKKCVDALKMSNVSVEEMDNTMLDVEDILAQSGAVVSDVSKVFDHNAPDDREIEAELESLLKDEEKKEATPEARPSDEGIRDLMDRLEALRRPITDSGEKTPSKKKIAQVL